MSEVKVNKISPRSGTDVQLGDSGDTITVPTGATLDTSNSTVTLPDGSIGLAKLSATGTKDATTFLRGDNSFQTVSSYTDSDALSLFNASGSAPVYACRAWVNFNGQGTVAIREDGNVSSITDNGTGDYTVNFTTAMPDANYSIVGSSGGQNGTTSGAVYLYDQATARTTALCRVLGVTSAGGVSDAPQINVAIFR